MVHIFLKIIDHGLDLGLITKHKIKTTSLEDKATAGRPSSKNLSHNQGQGLPFLCVL